MDASDDDASDRFAARVEAEVSRVLRHRRAIRDDALESRVREAESNSKRRASPRRKRRAPPNAPARRRNEGDTSNVSWTRARAAGFGVPSGFDVAGSGFDAASFAARLASAEKACELAREETATANRTADECRRAESAARDAARDAEVTFARTLADAERAAEAKIRQAERERDAA